MVKAVDGVSFDVQRGEVLGLVGESGCGKSVTSLSILRLVGPPGKIDGGEILFEGRDLLKLSTGEMTKIRGDRIAMIFQQPTSSLESGVQGGRSDRRSPADSSGPGQEAGLARAMELLKLVGISDPQRRVKPIRSNCRAAWPSG